MSDASIGFDELCLVLRRLGFEERIRGSHHIFTRDDIPEILNLQPRGSKAKAQEQAGINFPVSSGSRVAGINGAARRAAGA